MEIVPLRSDHVEDAARLFADVFRARRVSVPALPPRHAEAHAIAPLLADLVDRQPGVAALAGGRLVGYLIGFSIPEFKGTARGALSPIFANAAAEADRAQTYRQMYAALAREWVSSGCLTHALTVYADDRPTQDALHWLGFGLLVVDAIRSLDPLDAHAPAGVTIRRATVADVPLVLPLEWALGEHLAAAPTFLPILERTSEAEASEWLADPARAVFLAEVDGEPIGYVRCQPSTFGVAHVVTDPATIHVTGAYLKPDARGQGTADALLASLLDWARERGHARCAVDFESANPTASRYWPRHFSPVCHSLIRRLDEQIARDG